jgi:inner membrane transporter RhtA
MPASSPVPVSPSMTASVGLLVAAMASIQGGAAVAAGLFPLAGPAGVTALRLVFGTVLLAVALQPWKAKLTSDNWRPVVLYGVALGLMNLLFYEALARIPLGLAVALEFAGPLALSAFGSRRPLDLFWVVLAAGGLALLTPWAGGADLDPLGVVFALAAGSCWAAYIVTGRRAGAAHGARATALGCAVAALAVAPFGIAQAGMSLLNPALMGPALAVALLSTAVPYTLEMIVLGRMPMRVFGVLMSLEPAIAALSGLLLLHQALGAQQLLAIAAVTAASAGVAVTASRD